MNDNKNIQIETLKRPVIIEKYDLFEYNQKNNIKKNKNINTIKSNYISCRNDICYKYNINIKEKVKIGELLKEHKFEFKHKKNLLKRGRFLKHNNIKNYNFYK